MLFPCLRAFAVLAYPQMYSFVSFAHPFDRMNHADHCLTRNAHSIP